MNEFFSAFPFEGFSLPFKNGLYNAEESGSGIPTLISEFIFLIIKKTTFICLFRVFASLFKVLCTVSTVFCCSLCRVLCNWKMRRIAGGEMQASTFIITRLFKYPEVGREQKNNSVIRSFKHYNAL